MDSTGLHFRKNPFCFGARLRPCRKPSRTGTALAPEVPYLMQQYAARKSSQSELQVVTYSDAGTPPDAAPGEINLR